MLGAALLARPTSFLLLPGALIAWWAICGARRGIALMALCAAVAVLCVAPWTIRNAFVEHGFLPISLQDAAAYGTFNAAAAHDRANPYFWRPLPAGERRLLLKPTTDLHFRSRLDHLAISYIKAHPASVLAAFFWNGLSRLWDVRRPSRALYEDGGEGRSSTVTTIGIYSYYPVFVLALVGLWLARRRRWLVGAILAMALTASVVYTTDSGTRYRAPFEPLIVIFACSTVVALAERRRPAAAPAHAAVPAGDSSSGLR